MKSNPVILSMIDTISFMAIIAMLVLWIFKIGSVAAILCAVIVACLGIHLLIVRKICFYNGQMEYDINEMIMYILGALAIASSVFAFA